jgi:hypothetical protein
MQQVNMRQHSSGSRQPRVHLLTAGLDPDALLLVGGLVLGRHVHNAVGVNVKRHLQATTDTRNSRYTLRTACAADHNMQLRSSTTAARKQPAGSAHPTSLQCHTMPLHPAVSRNDVSKLTMCSST